jgi:hypothetical protein
MDREKGSKGDIYIVLYCFFYHTTSQKQRETTQRQLSLGAYTMGSINTAPAPLPTIKLNDGNEIPMVSYVSLYVFDMKLTRHR